LSLPPDYGLRPPSPGAQRPQETAVKDEARRLLITSGGGTATETMSAPSVGEEALLSKAGAANTDPSIRQKVSRENSLLASGDKGFVDRLMFWRNKDEEQHSEIDPTKEARRLSENAAMGDPATKGPTPWSAAAALLNNRLYGPAGSSEPERARLWPYVMWLVLFS
jgi:hypothetical protein